MFAIEVKDSKLGGTNSCKKDGNILHVSLPSLNEQTRKREYWVKSE